MGLIQSGETLGETAFFLEGFEKEPDVPASLLRDSKRNGLRVQGQQVASGSWKPPPAESQQNRDVSAAAARH